MTGKQESKQAVKYASQPADNTERSMVLINGNDVTTLTGNDFMIDDELTI